MLCSISNTRRPLGLISHCGSFAATIDQSKSCESQSYELAFAKYSRQVLTAGIFKSLQKGMLEDFCISYYVLAFNSNIQRLIKDDHYPDTVQCWDLRNRDAPTQ
jgi:hypothetical protein